MDAIKISHLVNIAAAIAAEEPRNPLDGEQSTTELHGATIAAPSRSLITRQCESVSNSLHQVKYLAVYWSLLIFCIQMFFLNIEGCTGIIARCRAIIT